MRSSPFACAIVAIASACTPTHPERPAPRASSRVERPVAAAPAPAPVPVVTPTEAAAAPNPAASAVEAPADEGGPVALLVVGRCEEEEHGVTPAACHDGDWIRKPEQCLDRIKPGAIVTSADGKHGVVGRRLTPGEDEEPCVVVKPFGSKMPYRGVATSATHTGARCGPSHSNGRRVGTPPRVRLTAAAVAAYKPLAARHFRAVRKRLVGRALEAEDWLRLELDGDGKDDTVVSLDVDGECHVVAVEWGDGRAAELVFHSTSCRKKEGEHDFWSLPLQFDGEDQCHDLDGDGRVEFVIGEGGETERSDYYVEWDGDSLESVGVTRFLGD